MNMSLTEQIADAAGKMEAIKEYKSQLTAEIGTWQQEVERLRAERDGLEAKLTEARQKLEELEAMQNEVIGLLSERDHYWVMMKLSYIGRLFNSPDTIDQTVHLVEGGNPEKLLEIKIETDLGCDCGVNGFSHKITLSSTNAGVLALIRRHIRVEGESEYDERPTPSLRTYWHGNWDSFTHVRFSDEVCSYKASE